jgi:hypothetical protein
MKSEKTKTLSASRRNFIGMATALAAAATLMPAGSAAETEDRSVAMLVSATTEEVRRSKVDTSKLCDCWKGCKPLLEQIINNVEVAKWLRFVLGLAVAVIDGLCKKQ